VRDPVGDALEDVVTPDEPINVPGLTSGESIQKSGGETVTEKVRIGVTMLTTDRIRFAGVPVVLAL
jgi:hypothetical protein